MKVNILVNGVVLSVASGTTLASALGACAVRHSVQGQSRAPYCGMGVCFECRVTIDGRPYQRACQVLVHDGMEVRHEG
ncbi:(2Fe-2S)-binding protein [Chitinimonas sp.]|uniref:(2Fe-2S)-binding protein n=1 Tax=Chitinimonas sp. TaxID=1934313 RepID=UPI002F94690F